jgi:hypothetical protein
MQIIFKIHLIFLKRRLAISQKLQPYFFSYADPSEKFQFSNRYNFCSDELFRVKSAKISILIRVLLLLAHKKSLRCLVSILDFKIFHLGRHRKKNTAVLDIWNERNHIYQKSLSQHKFFFSLLCFRSLSFLKIA